VDEARRRLLANHTANNTLDVFDLDSGKLIKQVPTGKAQGVAVVPEAGRYCVAVSREQAVVVINSQTLEKTGTIQLAGPADAIAFNPKNHCVYVGHDDGPHLWVIDTRTEKIVATIDIPEGPEWVLWDASTDRIFQNIKSNDSLLVIDPARNTIRERWATAPAKSPHGLALNAKTHRLFCAGTNGKLAVLNAGDGKLLGSADMVTGVDQIAFDAAKDRLYCPSSSGKMTVLDTSGNSVKPIGDVTTARGAKTVAFDPKTHAVWLAYAEGGKCFVRKFTPPQ
jgi:DNA-binding beta-propeller fold protein YncE